MTDPRYGCAPPSEATPDTIDPNDPCQMFAALRQAHLSLLTGNKRSTVKFHDREARYFRSDLHLLAAEMRKYEAICARTPAGPAYGARSSYGAVRGGPYVPRLAGYMPPFPYPFRY